MTATIRHIAPLLVLLSGCTSQPFWEFPDNAPILELGDNLDYPDGNGYGRVMAEMMMGHPDITGREHFLAASAGAGTQVEVFRLDNEGDLDPTHSSVLANICSTEDRGGAVPDCYNRGVGVALAYRSAWREHEDCLVVGMEGDDTEANPADRRRAGIGFWCSMGAGGVHPSGDGSPGPYMMETQPDQAEPDRPVTSMVTVLSPEERLFVATERALLVLEGSQNYLVPVQWDVDGLPPQASHIDAIDAYETSEVPGGFLLAIGVADRQQVLIAEYRPDDEATPDDEDPTLVPRACIEVGEDGFGSVLRLSPLEPGGQPYLLAAASRDYPTSREEAVHLFPIDLSVDPADVTCAETSPELSLRCAQTVTDQGQEITRGASCDVEGSFFGVAFDVGDIDDTPEYEVIVGSPGAEVDGFERAGAAYVFRPAADGEVPLEVLTDEASTTFPFEVDRKDDRLGDGVRIVDVGDREEVVLAAPGPRRLLMYLCTGVGSAAPGWDRPVSGGSLVDPRCRNSER